MRTKIQRLALLGVLMGGLLAGGSGTGGFAGATGRLDFKDDVDNAVFYYRGHIKLG